MSISGELRTGSENNAIDKKHGYWTALLCLILEPTRTGRLAFHYKNNYTMTHTKVVAERQT